MLKRLCIRVSGIVQGVGFRPFIYRLALQNRVRGYVLNDTEGVMLEVEGKESALSNFLKSLKEEFPPLAIIQNIDVKECEPRYYETFEIKKSRRTDRKTTFIPPDTAVCDDCLKEFFDRSDRRYHYPFITCTYCGPRFSIIRDIPYDRENTTMNEFPMCSDCRREYDDPTDRRFHTQPTACHVCGPHLSMYNSRRRLISEDTDEIVKKTYRFLKEGYVVAIKGVGGFHLACNATNDRAVLKLRNRKKRPFKPFAIMAGSVGKIKEFLEVSEVEERLLLSKERPILLLKEKKPIISRYVAPYLSHVGVMLPYTPFQHLLFSLDRDMLLVMTSGNITDEPIVFDDEDAFERLGRIADYFVIYNRKIVAQSDDSVMFVEGLKSFFVRRSRGFVPVPFLVRDGFKRHIFAAGADLKSSFAIARDNVVVLSQYLGDMESVITHETYKYTLEHFKKVFDFHPQIFISDMHPGYFTTLLADRMAGEKRRIRVQHHHAHIASVMAEHQVDEPVIGVAFDGTGYGTDGKIWGSEFLIADMKDFKRAGHLSYFGLPGGEKAIKEVWRIGLSLLFKAGLESEFKDVDKRPFNIVLKMLKKGFNTPETCSVGRLFDGVAFILGISDVITAEAEAAQKLEEAATRSEEQYKIEITCIENERGELVVPVEDIVKGVIHLKKGGISVSDIAMAFHTTLIDVSFSIVQMLRDRYGLKKVVLSGGAFQNRILLSGLWRRLENDGFEVLLPHRISLNDGGIALGQIFIGRNLVEEEGGL